MGGGEKKSQDVSMAGDLAAVKQIISMFCLQPTVRTPPPVFHTRPVNSRRSPPPLALIPRRRSSVGLMHFSRTDRGVLSLNSICAGMRGERSPPKFATA